MSKENEFIEKLVHVNRITKVVKGGRRFGFSALVVVGNQSGKIGIAHAKSKQVPDAIKKANEMAKQLEELDKDSDDYEKNLSLFEAYRENIMEDVIKKSISDPLAVNV